MEIGARIEVINSEHPYFLKRGEIVNIVDDIYKVQLDYVERIVILKEQDMVRQLK